MGEIVLIRHGQTEWSANGRHTSYTDLDLTEEGERQARAVADRVKDRKFVAVISSPRHRALRTAELAGLKVTETTDDLVEWNYGSYEGITSAEIHKTDPDWWLFRDGAPGGESPEQISERIDRVLEKVRPLLDEGDVALIGHGHALRVVGARWIGMPAEGGGRLKLGTATLSILGFDHGRTAIDTWNSPCG